MISTVLEQEAKQVAMPRILIIDDEDDIREVAQLSLEIMAGWDTLVAASGAEGLELAINEQPDAILLDVMMPEMDGPATFRHLQSDPKTQDIPVIFLTAKISTSKAKSHFQAMGVAGVIAKPFEATELASLIGQKMGWWPQHSG